MKKIFLLFLGLILYAGEVIHICDDSAQWPPFIFKKNINGKEKLVGVSVDIADEVFKRIGKNYKIDLIPWKRCLYLVENYDKVHKYEMFMDGTYSKKRAENFYLTDSIYHTHPVIWFNKDKYTKEEFKKIIHTNPDKLRYCDVNGYQVAKYHKFLGVSKDKKIDQGAKSSCDALRKISENRCDAMIAAYEGMIGYKVTGQCKIPENITYIDIPVKHKAEFYMFIAKKYPKAKTLLNEINTALKEMKKDGTYQKILDKWLKF